MAEKGVNLPTPCATIKSYTKIIRPPFPPILPQSLCHSLEMPAHSHLSMTFIRSPGIVQGIHRGFKLAFTLTIYPHLTFWPALSSSPGPSTSLSRWVEVALLSDWCRFAWPMMPDPWCLKIFSVWNHHTHKDCEDNSYLKNIKFTCFELSWASDKLVKSLLGKESEWEV